ncbi:MAG TPA: iron-containing alcohol dehydrogenase [Clostridiales bacterium]|nr:iron-containing alcohol dehydrogenase [Clostridiales bacterium]
MNVFMKMWCRTYQFGFKIAMYFLPWRKAKTLVGENSLLLLPELIKSEGYDKVLIVTDKTLVKLGLINPLLEQLKKEQVEFVIYDETVPNPTIDNIMDAYKLYQEGNCQGVIAFGGGSPMDCAKGVAAKATRPKRDIAKMEGLLKVGKKTPPIFAIPTTAGTGSEVTLAAVITDSKKHHKLVINDPMLIPEYVVLDPVLTIGLPKHITATTGLDALTHAVEAFIGNTRTKDTKAQAIEATKLIFENIKKVYDNGEDIKARENMLIASNLAGKAFTRSYVGYVHSIAHTLGGQYKIPHGLANAIILPHILRWYGASAHKKLAVLGRAVGLSGENDEVISNKFIEEIEKLKKYCNIPDKFENVIKDEDILQMAEYSLKEANPLYPVPKLMGKNEMIDMYKHLKA